jgi:hypothetical protein
MVKHGDRHGPQVAAPAVARGARAPARSLLAAVVRPLAPAPAAAPAAPAAVRAPRPHAGFELAKVAIERAPGRTAERAPERTPERERRRQLASARDPAAIIDAARRAPPVTLPHQAAAARVFGVGLDGIEVHTGAAAAHACRALGASALAVQNVVLFADDAPALDLVLHEVAHVLQQDGLGDRAPARFAPGSLRTSRADEPAEREAAAAAAAARAPADPRRRRPRLRRAVVAVYREEQPARPEDKVDPPKSGDPEPLVVTPPADLTEPAAKRLWIFATYSPWKATDQSTVPAGPRFGTRNATAAPPTYEEIKVSSPEPWRQEDYRTFMLSERGKELLLAANMKEVTDGTAGVDVSTHLKKYVKRLKVADVRRYTTDKTGPYAFLGEELTTVFDLRNAETRIIKFRSHETHGLSDAGRDFYGRKKDLSEPDNGDDKWILKYPQGSKETFQSEDYAGIAGGYGNADADTPTDLLTAFDKQLNEAHGLARVGDTPGVRSYAFVAGAKPYFDLVQQTTKKPKKKRTPAQLIADYKAILQRIDRLKSATLPDRDPNHNPKDASAARPDKKDVRHARKELMRLIVDAYDDKQGALFFKEIIDTQAGGTDLFGNTYARIKGNVFEQWIFKWRFQGKTNVQLIKAQPYFEWDEAGATPESARIQKTRMGDGILIGSNKDNVILEAKAYTAKKVPTLGNEKAADSEEATKDDDLVLQMRDYATIIGSGKTKKPIYGRFLAPSTATGEEDELEVELEESPKQKGPPQTPQQMLFQYILYEFADVKVAERWQKALQATLKNVYATDPVIAGDDASKAVRLQIGLNPTIPVALPNTATLEQKITSFPDLKQPGVTVKEANIKLAVPGKTLLTPGSNLVMRVDMKGLKQEEDVTKPIEPVVSEASAAKPGAPAKPLHGRAANKFAGLKSSLDKFLSRLHTDARLIDGGVEAELTVTDGASGIPGLNLVGTFLKARYTQQGLGIEGRVGVERPDKTIAGSVTVKYESDDWTFTGEVTVKDLITGLDPFTARIYVRGEDKRIEADLVKISRTLGAVTLTGSLAKVSYDLTTKAFNADVSLDAAIPAFGTVNATGKVVNNEIDKLTFSYESKKLAYGPKNAPIIEGTLSGSATFDKGKFSQATIGGTAYLRLPALEKIAKGLGDLGFVINATITAEGKVSGSIATASDKPIELGKYFRIPLLRVDLKEDGTISSDFALEVVNLKWVKEARVDCRISSTGFEVLKASGKLKVGDETKDRLAAEVGLSYDKSSEAFIVSGTIWLRIKEGMVGKGWFSWNSATGKMDAELGIDKITLLAFKGDKDFLKIKKQIPLFMIYALGAYLEIGLELGFKYGFSLAITPTVRLSGLRFDENDEIAFDLAVAKVKLEGELSATLLGTPIIGIGIFAFNTSLLRGGGGIKVPIAATAKAKPAGEVEVQYKPDGTLSGGGRVGITLTFGIKGQIKPYAELSVLNGTWEPNWEGDSLYDFVILEERELFTYFIDFGAPLTKEENPSIPGGQKAKAPPAKASDEKKRIDGKPEGDKGTEPAKGARQAEGKKSVETEAPPASNGFDLKGMIDKLLLQPKFAPIKKVMQAASDAWDAIAGTVGKIINFFKKWFNTLVEGVDALIDAIRTIAKEGLIAYFKKLLKQKLGWLYDVVAPLFEALAKVAGRFEALLEKLIDNPIPTTVGAFMDWTIDTVASVLGLVVNSLATLAQAIIEIVKNALEAAGRFINALVQTGKIGVRRHVYYVPRPFVSNIYFYAPTEYKIDAFGFEAGPYQQPGNLVDLSDVVQPWKAVDKAVRAAIAFALWTALDNIYEVKPTRGSWQDADDSDVGSERRNYWVD